MLAVPPMHANISVPIKSEATFWKKASDLRAHTIRSEVRARTVRTLRGAKRKSNFGTFFKGRSPFTSGYSQKAAKSIFGHFPVESTTF